MIEFQDRVAIVTGAGRGLGRSHARLLAGRGAAVVVNDPGVATDGTASDSRPAEEVAAGIREAGGVAVADFNSVATPEGGEAIVARAIEEFGRIDILINNAGILRDKSFAKLEWPDLDAVVDVHLKGAFYVSKPAFLHMKEQSYGRILVTASNAGIAGNFGQTNYGAAKAGLVGFMNVLKLEGRKYNVLVNALAPIARTRMTEDLLGPMAEHLDPDSVAPAAAYLVSEECQFTGEVWSVGGGSVSRYFIGLTEGYFKHPGKQGALTIEDVAKHVDDIRLEDGYIVPFSVADEFTKLAPQLGG